MQIASLVAVYFVVWWLTLFMVLPFGARSQVDAGDVLRGSEPGAPAVLRLWPKLLATTVLAAVFMALLMWGLSNPVLREYWR
jgi:predicted secreted protein